MNRALPCTGQSALLHCVVVSRDREMKEQTGYQGTRDEVFSRVVKGGGVIWISAKKERALSMKGVWA